ncbi:hypothetical protein L596_017800 [Steinernema carpocapsae]|uniref:Uncharacterized protein n=1 Tax=Steinernema carpocapsae TaxID=34508 RepID=A0A4U5N3I3_STECR|nr:hypothetical protein L596_017800 [Steinernema carpocapsae]
MASSPRSPSESSSSVSILRASPLSEATEALVVRLDRLRLSSSSTCSCSSCVQTEADEFSRRDDDTLDAYLNDLDAVDKLKQRYGVNPPPPPPRVSRNRNNNGTKIPGIWSIFNRVAEREETIVYAFAFTDDQRQRIRIRWPGYMCEEDESDSGSEKNGKNCADHLGRKKKPKKKKSPKPRCGCQGRAKSAKLDFCPGCCPGTREGSPKCRPKTSRPKCGSVPVKQQELTEEGGSVKDVRSLGRPVMGLKKRKNAAKLSKEKGARSRRLDHKERQKSGKKADTMRG